MTYSTITVEKISPHVGAVIGGVDLTLPLDDQVVAEIRRALVDHGIIGFRDQPMSVDEQIAFAGRFGRLYVHPTAMSLNPTHPEVFPIRADENSKKVYGEDWHTDASCDEAPPLGSVLRLTELPPVGGDTMFSGMYAAYDLLSPTMQTFLEGLTAVHDGNRMFRGREFEEKEYPRSEHPVVATHPETGRKLIFVNRMYVSHIVQLSARESEAVLQMLYRLVETPEIQCRFVWQPNSVVFWDNRCVQHKAVFDYFPHRRIGTRVQVCGSRPVARPTETQAPHAAARGHLVAA